MRLFIAIPVPDPVRDGLDRLQYGLEEARWVPWDNLHLTLRFIGDVDPGMATEIGLALAGIDADAFAIRLSGVDLFGSQRKPRSLHVRADASEPLKALQLRVERACQQAGCVAESRRFVPHVTLARFSGQGPARLGPYIQANNLFAHGPFLVDRFALFESTLHHGGAIYTELAEFPLRTLGEPESV